MTSTSRREHSSSTAIMLVALSLVMPASCKLDERNLGSVADAATGGADADAGPAGARPDDAPDDAPDDGDPDASGPAADAVDDLGEPDATSVAVACEVSDWGDFQPCTSECGGGTQIRTRAVVTPASGGGAPCPTLVETRACNAQPCPTDCVLSDWGPWSNCTKECGGGSRTRTRMVVTPPNGGAPCGALEQTEACNTAAPNGCGGCGTLTAAPQSACGKCGKAMCAGPNQITCDDPGRTCQQLGATCGGPPDGCGGKLSCGACPDALTSCSTTFTCGCGKPTSLGSPAGVLESGKKAISPDGHFYANADGIFLTAGQLVMALASVKGFDWHPSRPGRFAIMRHFAPPQPLTVIEVHQIDASGQVMLIASADSNSQWHHYLAWRDDEMVALGAENACLTVTTVKPEAP